MANDCHFCCRHSNVLATLASYSIFSPVLALPDGPKGSILSKFSSLSLSPLYDDPDHLSLCDSPMTVVELLMMVLKTTKQI